MRWQRIARLVIATAAIAFAIVVGTSMRQRTTPKAAPPVPRADPTAVVESEGGSTVRINRNQEEGLLKYQRLLTYANGASKMIGVTITTNRRGQTFTVSGAEGQAGENDSTMELSGGVRLESTDGLVLTADRATYSKAENVVRVPGAVSFSRGRMTGTGIGLDYNQTEDVIVIGDRAAIDVKANKNGAGALTLASGALEFRRVEEIIRLDRGAKITRDGQIVEADLAIAHLSADEERLELLELRNNSRITGSPSSAGGLQNLSGRDIDLRYGGDAQQLQHANINGDAVAQLAGERRQPGRQIAASAMDIGIGPDGTTPTALIARENVKVTLPGEEGSATRVIAAQALDGTGDGRRGLTGAHFTGNVQFSERGGGVDRAARSAVLDVVMAPGFGAIEDANFTRGVRFADGPMFATSAAARYALKQGVLELTGSEPGSLAPHVLNEQIAVDATRIDVTLEGPVLNAKGAVKSVLQPKKAGASAKDSAKMPSMLKDDQPVNVTADQLAYDGNTSRARLHRRGAPLAGGDIGQGLDDHDRQQERRPRRQRARDDVRDSPAGRRQGRQGKGQLDRHVEGFRIPGLASTRDLHRRRAHHRSAGRPHVAEGRAVPQGVGRRTRSRRGVRRRRPARRRAQDDRPAAHVLRRRPALPGDRIAGHHPRRMRPRNHRPHVDLLQDHR